MSQNPYENPEAARTYDEENAGRQDFDFYLELARKLSPDGPGLSVLDSGAGTGALGVELAAAGHRVTGVVETRCGVTERAGTRSFSAPETLAFRPLATLEASLEQAGFEIPRPPGRKFVAVRRAGDNIAGERGLCDRGSRMAGTMPVGASRSIHSL